MSQPLYSVEKVAELLGLHVRTVRGYVRDGRLKATRIGKQYRIQAEDLAALTGAPVSAPAEARRTRHVEVTTVVEIDAIDPDQASRISNGMVGAANRGPGQGPRLRIDAVYDESRARLKLILTGGLADVTGLLGLAALYLEPAP